MIGITSFARRRRRRARPRSILTFSTDSGEADPEPIFDPYPYEAVQDSRISAEQQPLVTEAEMVALHRRSSALPTAPVPVGLSDKEIARLRVEGYNSQQSLDDPRRLHSEVESLVRREMERLHAEGLVIAPPPSYSAEDDG